mgnify:CR=1 FL=1
MNSSFLVQSSPAIPPVIPAYSAIWPDMFWPVNGLAEQRFLPFRQVSNTEPSSVHRIQPLKRCLVCALFVILHNFWKSILLSGICSRNVIRFVFFRQRLSLLRISARLIFPLNVFGISSTNSMIRGYLYGAVVRLTWSCSSFFSASDGTVPWTRTTVAFTI